MHRVSALALGVLLSMSSQTGFAQEAPPLRDDIRRNRPVLFPGDIVRITAPNVSVDFIEGHVVGIGPDSLVVEGRKELEGRTAVAYEDMDTLEVLDESTSGIGSVLGVLAGLLAGATLAGELADNASDVVRNLSVAGGAAVGAYGGYWAGVRIERLIAGPQWEPIEVSQLRLGFESMPEDYIAFTVSYNF